MKHVEIKRLKNVDLIVTHNEKDKMLLESKEFCPNKIISIVPYFKKMKINYKGENSRNIVFFGAMSRPENYKSAIWFIKNVFFKIEKYGYRFIILGNNPASELLKYKSDNIEITGFVEDIAPYFERALCFVAPLIMGGGIKIKVLEALTSGVPVITNSIGIEGIPAVPDRDYIYCEKPKEYIEAIEKLTNNIEYAKKIGNNGRNIVEGNFNIDKSVEQYIQTILKI